jgi:hypothetical protein
MESTQKKSSNSRVHRSDRIKQIFALVSMVSFGGSAIFGVVSLFSSGLSSQHQQKSAPVAVSQESLLAAQERGYVGFCSGNRRIRRLWRDWQMCGCR